MARIRKKPGQRRLEILDASLDLFVQNGFHNIVIGDIAKAVGLSRTSFYEYYSNKEQILIELVDRVATQTHSIKAEGKNCYEKLENAARNTLRQVCENKQVYYLIFREAPVLSAMFTENLLKWRSEGFVQVREIISEALAAGELNTEVNEEDAAFAFQALLGQRAGDFILTGETIDIDQEAKRLVTILWLGLAKR
jgi:AcrR family transcriptional regulator